MLRYKSDKMYMNMKYICIYKMTALISANKFLRCGKLKKDWISKNKALKKADSDVPRVYVYR